MTYLALAFLGSLKGLYASENHNPSFEQPLAKRGGDKATDNGYLVFESLKGQEEISRYTTQSILDRYFLEICFLRKLEVDGHQVAGLEKIIACRLDSLVPLAENSEPSPREAALAVTVYLADVTMFFKAADSGAIADECMKLLRGRENALVAVPLYYYAKYIGGKILNAPTSVDVDQYIRLACECYFNSNAPTAPKDVLGNKGVPWVQFAVKPSIRIAWPKMHVITPKTSTFMGVSVSPIVKIERANINIRGIYSMFPESEVTTFDLSKLGMKKEQIVSTKAFWVDPDGNKQVMAIELERE